MIRNFKFQMLTKANLSRIGCQCILVCSRKCNSHVSFGTSLRSCRSCLNSSYCNTLVCRGISAGRSFLCRNPPGNTLGHTHPSHFFRRMYPHPWSCTQGMNWAKFWAYNNFPLRCNEVLVWFLRAMNRVLHQFGANLPRSVPLDKVPTCCY